MGDLTSIAAYALLLEAFIEHAKSQFGFLKGQVINAVSYAAGVGIAFAFDLHAFQTTSVTVSKVLTGLVVGAGSSFVYETINKLSGGKQEF